MSKEINPEGYRLAHTMMRVKDLEASFNFYCKTLGMKVLRKTDYPDGKFTNAFIGYGLETESPCLELTCNWDQKEDYDKGNGWGHVCIETPDVYKACEDLEKLGVHLFDEIHEAIEQANNERSNQGLVKLSTSYKPNTNNQMEYDILGRISNDRQNQNVFSSVLGSTKQLEEVRPYSINQNINYYYKLYLQV